MSSNNRGSYREFIDRLVLAGASGVFFLGLAGLSKLYEQYNKVLDEHASIISRNSENLTRIQSRLERQEERIDAARLSLEELTKEIRHTWFLRQNKGESHENTN